MISRKNFKKQILSLTMGFMILVAPLAIVHVAHASEPIVPSCNTGPLVNGDQVFKSDGVTPLKDDAGNLVYEQVYKNPCDFEYAIKLINNVIHFLLFTIAPSFVALILIYAGFLLLTSGGSSEARTKAKKIIKNVIVGYIVALAAWIIIHTILSVSGFTGPTFLKG